ncbi:MAG TPA: NlpC/P60 family protein [Acidimicrobiales bacterium]|jgi:cell wall-associated NlpC family hydrolase
MLRVRRRSTIRILSLLVLAVLSSTGTLVPTSAGARTITQSKTAMADLSAALARQEKRSEISANEYDADEAKLNSITGNIQTLDANISNLKSKEAKKRAQVQVTKQKLVVAVVRAYVLGASTEQMIQLFNQNVTQSNDAKVYQREVVGDLDSLKNKLQREKASLERTVSKVAAQRAKVNAQRAKASQQTYAMKELLDSNVALENSTQAELASVTAQYRVQLINYEIAVGVAAAKDKNTAAEEQAITAASEFGQAAANEVIEAEQAAASTPTIAEVAGTAQGAAAVRYAESQIGVPYVWGGETSGVGFDCSGLVQWAWGKAGISIPRTTETQWPDMVHVALTDLQPGDLLFYFNLDGDNSVDHVVMYVGSGPYGVDTTIAAPYTGTDVSLAPIFTAGLIGAARP